MKFRKGDRVRVTNPNPDVVEYTGFVGTVQDTSGVFFPVDVDFGEVAPPGRRSENAFFEEELTMVQPLFQDGDQVRLIDDEVVHTFSIGDIGVIKGESSAPDSERKVWDMMVPGSKSQLVYEKHIERVDSPVEESTTPTFRDGDKVRLIDDQIVCAFGIGAIGTIERDTSDPSPPPEGEWLMHVPGSRSQYVLEHHIEKVSESEIGREQDGDLDSQKATYDVTIYFKDTSMSATGVDLTENMTSIEIYDWFDGTRSVIPLAAILYYEVTPSDR